MKKLAFIFFFLVSIVLLNACATQSLATPVLATLDISPTFTKLPKATVMPTVTATITPTAEPEVMLSKVKEWNGSIPVAWTKDSKHFALLSNDKVELYDLAFKSLWSQNSSPLGAYIGMASAVTFSADDKFVIVYEAGIGPHLFDTNSGKLLASSIDNNCLNDNDLIHIDAYPSIMFTNSNILYVGFSGNNKLIERRPIQVSVWSVQPFRCKGKVITIPVPESGPSFVTTMSLSPNNDYLVLVSTHYYSDVYEGWIKVWDAKNYNQLCEIPGTYAVFRPSNGLLAVISKEESISYWDVAKCELIGSITIPKYKIGQEIDFNEQVMAFTTDGKYIIMRRASFQVFDANTGELVFDSKTIIGGGFGDISISPDGKYFFAQYNENVPITALWQINQK